MFFFQTDPRKKLFNLGLMIMFLIYETKYLFGAIIGKISKICRILKKASQDIHIRLYYFFY